MRRIVLLVASGMGGVLLGVHVWGLAGVPITDRHPWLLMLIPVLPACGLWVFADYRARGGPSAFEWFGLAESRSLPKWARVALLSAIAYAVVNMILIAGMNEHAMSGWVASLHANGFYTVNGGKEFVRVIDRAEHDRLRAVEGARFITTALAAAVFVILHCVTQRSAAPDASTAIRPKRASPTKP